MTEKKLAGKTVIVTGGSRGIGREIALRFAADGANIVLAAKTNVPHPKLPGTIFTVAEEVEKTGTKVLPIKCDVREELDIQSMVEKTVSTFGGVDILINNAGAINMTNTESTPVKRYDLMQGTNVRAVFLCTQAALPFLKKSANPHVLNLSPPIALDPKWLSPYLPYTISKYGMTLCTIGMAEEFKPYGIAVNSLWPRTLIATAAIQWLMGPEGVKRSRTPKIMADAAYEIVTTPSRELTGRAIIDEDFLRTKGYTDFKPYAVDPSTPLQNDLYIDS